MLNEILKALSQKDLISAKTMLESVLSEKIHSQIELARIETAEKMFNEGLDNGPGRISAPKLSYGQTNNSSGYVKNKEDLAKVKANNTSYSQAVSKAKATIPKPEKLPKLLDSSHKSIHKALETHLGGSFEHYENEPRHGHVTLPDGRKAASMDATVTHSYTHEDMGMHPHEMSDTAETYHVRVIKHPVHGFTVHHRSGRG
mgnify:FL=1